jgi:hypothetical protein
MESFKSRQFAVPQANTSKQPMKLNSHSRKLYPELASMLDLEAKQERLRKLRQSNEQTRNP